MDRGLPHLRSGKCPLCAPHNLEHNHVLHERNILLSVSAATTPRSSGGGAALDRVSFGRLHRYGYMEEPNVPRALRLARKLSPAQLPRQLPNSGRKVGRGNELAPYLPDGE